MEIKGKNIIVFGLGVTGKSTIKTLSKLGANVFIYDDREFNEIKTDIFDISEYDFTIIHEDVDIKWKDIYCVVKSPGIRLDNEFIKLSKKNNVEVISDIEMAYRLYGGENIIAVTGTNGKTTVTSLLYHIFNSNNIPTRKIGNIGIGLLWEMYQYGKDYMYIMEVSSFQLASIKEFKAKYSVILNISEDHTDWHGSFEKYKKDKLNIIKNVNNNDIVVINEDDSILNKIKTDALRYSFSMKEKTDLYFKNGKIIYKEKEFDIKNINLVGNHNISNIMASILVSIKYGLDFYKICKSVESFKALSHRIEFIREINGVKYFNDSKGTNIDSTRKAIEGFNQNIILIAGGYDKMNTFEDLFKGIKNIKKLILLGENRYKIEKSAIEAGLKDINLVENLQDALDLAKLSALPGEIVLLSPASASWGLYENYKQRGNHFRKIVESYGE